MATGTVPSRNEPVRVLQGAPFTAEWHNATLAGALVMTISYPNFLRLDPGGAHRDVTLPAESLCDGVFYEFVNAADAAENLVIKDDGGSTIGTINQNEKATFRCNGTAWLLWCVQTIALT
jgi:hypothetical protein